MENIWQQLTTFLTQSTTIWIAFGAVIVWILARLQTLTELRKTQTEINGLMLSQTEKWLTIDTRIRDVIKVQIQLVHQLTEAVQQHNIATAQTLRRQLMDMFTLDFVGGYYHFVGLGRWVFKGNERELIEDEIIPFLEMCTAMQRKLNDPQLLKLTAEHPLSMDADNYHFAIRFALRHLPYYTWRKRLYIQQLEITLTTVIKEHV
jgi:hypothetical protein